MGRQERPTLGGAQPEGLDGKQDGADVSALLAQKGKHHFMGHGPKGAKLMGRPSQRSPAGGGQPQGHHAVLLSLAIELRCTPSGQ